MNHSSIMYGTLSRVKVLAVCMTMLLACFTLGAQAKSFKSLSHIDGVTHVHIPKLLIKLAATNKEGLHLGNNITICDNSNHILSDISSVDVFTCEDQQAVKQLASGAQSLISGKGWEVLVSANDDGERVKICQNNSGKKNIIAIFAEEKNEVSLVVIKGKLDLVKLMEQEQAKTAKAE